MQLESAILKHYFNIIENEELANYLKTKYQKTTYEPDESLTSLWDKHDKLLDRIMISETKPKKSFLDLKIEIAKNLFARCCFCHHHCHVNREMQSGFCNVKKPCISSEFLHIGEEEALIPSHTIFFSGCTLQCVFCQNWDISQQQSGIYVKPDHLVEIIKKRFKQGSKNVNWVGGDPTPNILYILQVLKGLDENIAQVWNSNMYCSLETMKLLHGVIDVYLTDFKFGNDACAKRLAHIEEYTEIVKRNHILAYQQAEMIIRHLILPNHVECCSKPIIDWIAENIPGALVNIMGQYRPEYQAKKHEDISRMVSPDEINKVKKYAKEKQLNII